MKYIFVYNETEVVDAIEFESTINDQNGIELISDLTAKLAKITDDKGKVKTKEDAIKIVNYVLSELNDFRQKIDDKTNITYTLENTFISFPEKAKAYFDSINVTYDKFTDIINV